MEDVVVQKRPGRPKKDILERKNLRKMIRLDMDDYNMLYYLKGKLKKSDADIFREALERMFKDEIKR